MKFDEDIMDKVCNDIIQTSDAELYALSWDQLEKVYWFFDFKKEIKNIDYTYYEFFKALELYRSHCRRWEEYHKGCVCVVARVRERYLIPKIQEFRKMLGENNG